MRYSEILSKYIKASGMTLVDIVRECSANGIELTTSYLSKLKNGKMAPPRDRINKALEKVLNCKEDQLLVAAYREKIPEEIMKKLSIKQP